VYSQMSKHLLHCVHVLHADDTSGSEKRIWMCLITLDVLGGHSYEMDFHSRWSYRRHMCFSHNLDVVARRDYKRRYHDTFEQITGRRLEDA